MTLRHLFASLVFYSTLSAVLAFTPTPPTFQPQRQKQRNNKNIVVLGSTLSPTSSKSVGPTGDDDNDDDHDAQELAAKTKPKRVQISLPFLNKNKNSHAKQQETKSSPSSSPQESSSTPPLDYGPISMSINELAAKLGGRGRARLAWDCYSIGVDPANFYNDIIRLGDPSEVFETIYSELPTNRRTQRLGPKTLQALANLYKERRSMSSSSGTAATTSSNNSNQTTTTTNIVTQVEGGVARLAHVKTSRDRTTKLLLQLADGLQVETVIIPWNNVRSTLCISSQVGCRQACRFCATGKMGLIRNLNSDEILAQMFWARKLCRLHDLPPVTNIVFMGMGENSDNAEHVSRAAEILTTRELFQLSATKVTISTVGPTPQSFQQFCDTPAVLAWSVHAARDELRRELVPTTRYRMEELCEGLMATLNQRPLNFRTTMLEVVLIDQINDHVDTDGKALVDLCRKIVDGVPGCKLVVNLIPFNEIDTATKDLNRPMPSSVRAFRTPSEERVKAFQKYLWDNGVYAHVRQTRGDDESAACGQLATARQKHQQQRP